MGYTKPIDDSHIIYCALDTAYLISGLQKNLTSIIMGAAEWTESTFSWTSITSHSFSCSLDTLSHEIFIT